MILINEKILILILVIWLRNPGDVKLLIAQTVHLL